MHCPLFWNSANGIINFCSHQNASFQTFQVIDLRVVFCIYSSDLDLSNLWFDSNFCRSRYTLRFVVQCLNILRQHGDIPRPTILIWIGKDSWCPSSKYWPPLPDTSWLGVTCGICFHFEFIPEPQYYSYMVYSVYLGDKWLPRLSVQRNYVHSRYPHH